MKKETVVYTAGLFDGEGCIVITRGPKKNGRGKIYNCVAIRMEICNTDHDLIKWIKRDVVGFDNSLEHSGAIGLYTLSNKKNN